jgi:hypothetical protein
MVCHPQCVWAIRREISIRGIPGPGERAAGDTGKGLLALPNTVYFKVFHQACDRAAGDLDLFPIQLKPDFSDSVIVEVLIPNALNLWLQKIIPFGAI